MFFDGVQCLGLFTDPLQTEVTYFVLLCLSKKTNVDGTLVLLVIGFRCFRYDLASKQNVFLKMKYCHFVENKVMNAYNLIKIRQQYTPRIIEPECSL